MPTIPSPTTTIFFRCDGGFGYCDPSSSGSWPLTGVLLACMPGDELAHDILICIEGQSPVTRNVQPKIYMSTGVAREAEFS